MTRIRVPRGAVAAVLVLLLIAPLLGGCIFDTGLEATFFDNTVFISTNSSSSICSADEQVPPGFECTFFSDDGPISRFTIESLPEFLSLLILIDPLVVQFPATAGQFEGSFLHQGTGTGGSLSITTGLSSVPVDDTRALVAEPGNQLVIVELPPGAPISGDYSFHLHFNVPPGTTEVVAKPLFTGRVELTNGDVFYAPLYPCVSDLAAVPEVVISSDGSVTVPPPDPALACDDEVYQYLGGAAILPEGLEVDAEAVASDGNGVFEPGEQVETAPTWRNNGGDVVDLSGIATAITGPTGAVYTLAAVDADYGTLAPGASASCRDTGVCYAAEVDDPAPRPARHWDATVDETLADPDPNAAARTWTLHLGDSFPDVPRAHDFYRFVETLLHHQVTAGCSASEYCPASPNTRAQMAVFTLRSLEGAGYQPPTCQEDAETFTDVPFDSAFCSWIEELARRQVVVGCGGDAFCPGAPVTRAQMAIILLRTLEGSGYTPPACTGVFADVPCGSNFAAWIEELFTRQITAGCVDQPLRYCPGEPVTRGQMAVFLSRTFDLALYGP